MLFDFPLNEANVIILIIKQVKFFLKGKSGTDLT